MRVEYRTYTYNKRNGKELWGDEIAIMSDRGKVLFSFGTDLDIAARVGRELIRVATEVRAELDRWHEERNREEQERRKKKLSR